MSDDKPVSNLTSLVNRTVTAESKVSSTDHEAWRNDIEGRVTDLNEAVTDEANNRAGTSAPTDNTVEGQIWCDTTTDPAVPMFDPDGAGAADPIPAGNVKLRFKVVQIGDWDMDTDATASVAHGLTLANIRSVSALIRNDADTAVNDITTDINAGTGTSASRATATHVVLDRLTGGSFDSTSYDSTSFNRGWVTIWYVVT